MSERRRSEDEARAFEAGGWLAQQAKDNHADVWEVVVADCQASFKFEHNSRIYLVTVDELGYV